MLKDYKEVALLEYDLFGILAGIRMPIIQRGIMKRLYFNGMSTGRISLR